MTNLVILQNDILERRRALAKVYRLLLLRLAQWQSIQDAQIQQKEETTPEADED